MKRADWINLAVCVAITVAWQLAFGGGGSGTCVKCGAQTVAEGKAP